MHETKHTNVTLDDWTGDEESEVDISDRLFVEQLEDFYLTEDLGEE